MILDVNNLSNPRTRTKVREFQCPSYVLYILLLQYLFIKEYFFGQEIKK